MQSLADGHLVPDVEAEVCLTTLKSNQHITSICFELADISTEERDRLLTDFSAVNHIESIYLVGKPPETSERRNAFFTRFHKVCIFCEDEEEVAVRWALDTATERRRLGSQYAKEGMIDLARETFQQGKQIYARLAELIDKTESKV